MTKILRAVIYGSFCIIFKILNILLKKELIELFDKICLILSIIGSLNWGLVGLFQFDLVAWAFGGMDSIISRIIYTVIALAGIWCISLLFRDRTEAGD